MAFSAGHLSVFGNVSIRDHGFQGSFITPDAVGIFHQLLGKD
ncbi:hypothetical protein YSA_04232 [Pseudomonas putida ND6]|uniref:Uncharacterized protein n=1 Tax=Pseudomonas putida ND6 TaxID=231023 RepID=I3UU84_PSEPU|nr:hypothetical protein YSA_04232 [Pseudomonas putida ND6]